MSYFLIAAKKLKGYITDSLLLFTNQSAAYCRISDSCDPALR
jgi:hypothetical protein